MAKTSKKTQNEEAGKEKNHKSESNEDVIVDEDVKDSSSNVDVDADADANASSDAAESETDAVEKDPIDALKEALSSERDKYLRLAAEYDNFRKRSIKERESTYSDARADVITRLLPVYDNLERALKTECADESFYKGIEMTMTQLTEILENIGVVTIPAVGETFDPNRHNAVMTIENPELGEKVIAEEFLKGFMLGERVIRFSTVVVAN